jgi:hypothetical protein
MTSPNRRGSAPRRLTLALLLGLAGATAALAAPPVIYDNIPAPLPPNIPSEAFQSDHTAEFGEYIQFAGTDRMLTTVTVEMSDWAIYSLYSAPGSCPPSSACTAAGWMHPITLNIYNVVGSGATATPGTLLATKTQTFAIPWRPEPSGSCTGGAWLAGDGKCYGGFAFPITFDFTAMGVTLPNEVIYGVAFNTQTFGAAPIGAGGPFDALNVGVNHSDGPAPFGPPTVGSNPGDPDSAYQNFNSGGFTRITGWAPYSAAARFDAVSAGAVPALSPLALLFLGLAVAVIALRGMRV